MTTGIAMKDTEEETVGDTVVGTGDMNTKIVVIVLKYEICQKNVWLYRKWQILMESLVSAGTKNANFTFPFFFDKNLVISEDFLLSINKLAYNYVK